jgi:hypothetical protein
MALMTWRLPGKSVSTYLTSHWLWAGENKRATDRMVRKALFILYDLGQQLAWGERETKSLV